MFCGTSKRARAQRRGRNPSTAVQLRQACFSTLTVLHHRLPVSPLSVLPEEEQINIHSGLTRTSSPTVQPFNTSGPTDQTTLNSQPFCLLLQVEVDSLIPGSSLWAGRGEASETRGVRLCARARMCGSGRKPKIDKMIIGPFQAEPKCPRLSLDNISVWTQLLLWKNPILPLQRLSSSFQRGWGGGGGV